MELKIKLGVKVKDLLDKILLSNNVIDEFYKNYENPSFKKWILNILPEIEDCKNTKQDNPWHVYNCLDHILHSVENINKLSKGIDPKKNYYWHIQCFFMI